MANTVESIQIVPVKLDNSNYVHWASLMRNFLKGRNLWTYVTGVDISLPSSSILDQVPESLPIAPLRSKSSPDSASVLGFDLPSASLSAPPVAVNTSSRYSTRVHQKPTHLNDYECYFSALCSIHEPSSYREASSDPLWQKAIAKELHALAKTRTWDMVSLPPGKSVIDCKWIFKVKTATDGSVDRYKARLVAKGYAQEYGIDYEETFVPVARLTSVRLLIALAAVRQWDLFQMDVKNSFLNGTLTEEVYMKPPPGLSHLPGQSPQAWFFTFCSKIVEFGYTQSRHDSALFTRRPSRGDNLSGFSDLKTYLSSCFEMKDLGPLRYFLGVKYASDLINRVGLSDNKTFDTPLELKVKFQLIDGEELSDPTLYQKLVSGLIYLSITRPDISYAVHVVSQFMLAPMSVHYAVVLRILRYVKGSLLQGLFLSSASPLTLLAYSDACWVGDVTDRRSTTGYSVFLVHSLISWRSKKQSTVSRSSTKGEYRAPAAYWMSSRVSERYCKAPMVERYSVASGNAWSESFDILEPAEIGESDRQASRSVAYLV
ncbi:hypothetical protein H6P81_016216 [Aristolochia fimbriata]|uniref:Reverse transcriptase Ty1/copia-type domain-containing protein n=1 Tax=Aristolochia fimbriata TaxID=158543 RepID=A0AAV7E8Z0_ARIFI|nr:hypothetical protein H6P81_016216 [Aristolochia fimbriata]